MSSSNDDHTKTINEAGATLARNLIVEIDKWRPSLVAQYQLSDVSAAAITINAFLRITANEIARAYHVDEAKARRRLKQAVRELESEHNN